MARSNATQPLLHQLFTSSQGRFSRTATLRAERRVLALFLTLALTANLSGCGSGGYPGAGITAVSSSKITIDAGQSIQVTATDAGQEPIGWTLSGTACTGASCGTLSSSNTLQTTYTAPASVTTPLQVTLQVGVAGTGNSKIVAVTVNPAPVIATPPPAGTVSVPYTASLGVTGGTAPVTESQLSGTLPPGLSFDPAAGKVTGTPTLPGTFTIVLQATDTSDVPDTVSATETFVIGAPILPFAVPGGALPSGSVGMPYSTALQAVGGVGPYTWQLLSGTLPAGLSLSDAGVISGVPTVPGTASFTAQAKDATGAVASGAFTLPVTNTGNGGTSTIKLQPGILPSGTVGVSYSTTIGVAGGTPPYTCALNGTALPAGLTLGPNCLVSGTPRTAGSTNLSVAATDAANPANSGSGTDVLVINPAGTLSLTSPSAGTAGQPYTGAVGISGGMGPYTCALVAGSLPTGLTLASNCSLSGTPTTASSTSVTVTAKDSGDPAKTITGDVTVMVGPGPLSLDSGSVLDGTVGVAYSAPVPLTGGNSPYTCTLAGGALPSGLTLGSNCVITGVPTTAGTSSLTVNASDASNPAETTTGPLTITIHPQPTLALTSPPSATVGTPYTGTIGVAGGTAPYTCTLEGGTLPAGLSLDSDCKLTGTPTAAGSATLTVQATDSSQPARQTTGPVTVQVNPAPATLTVSSPPAATVGTPYTGSIPVNGGTAPYRCTLASGAVPAGLTLGADCSLTGAPTTAETTTVSVTATDSSNPAKTTTGPATITVNPQPALTFTGSLPNGVVGQPYLQTLAASGGVGPYTYAVTAGTLPAGLALASNGTLSGTPTTPGLGAFTVTATDSEGTPQTASLPLTLLITYPPTATDAELHGPYAFLFQGYDDTVAGVVAYQTASVGSLSADGNGVITSGEVDSNHQTSTVTGATIATQQALGTYTVGADGRGFLTLSTLNADGSLAATHTYALALHAPAVPAVVSDHGSLIEYDGDQVRGTRGSGQLRLQDSTAFAAGVSGSYAFGLVGDTPCTVSCGLNLSLFGPAAEVGQFTTDQNGITGTADANIANGNFPIDALTGSVAAADGDGRVALTLTTANLPVGVHPVDYAVYLINADQAFVMSTDKHSSYILLSGQAHRQQAAAFTDTSTTGAYVGYENAPTNPGLVGQTLANVTNLSTAVLFEGSGDGAGTCTTNLVDQAGATALTNSLTGLGGSLTGLQGVLGSYTATGTSACTVVANGREILNYVAPTVSVGGIVTVTGTAPAPRVAYLYGPNQGYFLETGYAGLGMLEQQAGAPFSVATLNGTFIYGQTDAASVASTNASGVFTANGQGTAQTTLDENVGVGTINALELGTTATDPYTLTSASFGRYLLGGSVVIYAISPTRFVLIDTNATTTSPSIALID